MSIEETLIRNIRWWTVLRNVFFFILLAVIAWVGWLNYERLNRTADRIDGNFRCAIEVFTSGKQNVTVKDYDKCVYQSRQVTQTPPPAQPISAVPTSNSIIIPRLMSVASSSMTISQPAPIQPAISPTVPSRVMETRINPQTGKTEVRYQGDTIWVEAQVQP